MWFWFFQFFFSYLDLFGYTVLYAVLADFVCGFAVLNEFFFGFAVSSVPQCPPPLYNAANDPQTGPQMIPAVAARDPAGKRAGNLMQG